MVYFVSVKKKTHEYCDLLREYVIKFYSVQCTFVCFFFSFDDQFYKKSIKAENMRKKRQYYVVRPLQCNYPNIPRLHWRRSTCPSVHHNTMGLIKQPGNLPCSDLYTHGCTFHMHTLLNEKRMFKHDRRICLASKFINKSSHMYIVKLIYNIY